MRDKLTKLRALPWVTLTGVVVLLTMHGLVVPNTTLTVWVLDAAKPTEIWRGITAHWVHTDTDHLIWNLLAWLVLAAYIEYNSRPRLLLSVLLGMLGVNLWFFTMGNTQLYCGLSGVLNTLLVFVLYLAGRQAMQRQDQLAQVAVVLVALGFVAKVIIEMLTPLRVAAVGIWPSAPGAHAAGLLAGGGWLAYHWLRQRWGGFAGKA